MALSQVETRYELRKLYRFLDSGPRFRLRKLKGYNGEIFGDRTTDQVLVDLDPRKHIISTLLHEYIHYQYPELSESDVMRFEISLVNSLSDRQVRNVIKRFAQAL